MTLKSLNRKTCCLRNKLKTCFAGHKGSCKNQTTSLSKACNPGRMKICKVTGDRKQCARMASMGVSPGKEVEIICPENGSACLLKIHGGTLSLDASASKNIFVTSV